MNKMLKAGFFIICALFTLTLFPVTVNADMGPKPSLNIKFKNMGDELCYCTLLADEPNVGRYSVWDGSEENAMHNRNEMYQYSLEYDIWKAFVEYKDTDGYYFIQPEVEKLNETKNLHWSYGIPDRFKILLYYPELDKFAVSGICERYAFFTYYTVDMEGVNISSVEYDGQLSNVYRSFHWKRELISLAIRIFFTMVIEMCIAFAYDFMGKKECLLLVIVNTITQIFLNVLLDIINFTPGHWKFNAVYVALEILVFAIEAVVYSVYMKRFATKAKPTRFYVEYALAANAVSFAAGFTIAKILPGIF